MFQLLSSLIFSLQKRNFHFFVDGYFVCLTIMMLLGYVVYQKLLLTAAADQILLKTEHNQELRMCICIMHKQVRAIKMEIEDIKTNTKRQDVYIVHGDLFSGRSTKVEHKYADGRAY